MRYTIVHALPRTPRPQNRTTEHTCCHKVANLSPLDLRGSLVFFGLEQLGQLLSHPVSIGNGSLVRLELLRQLPQGRGSFLPLKNFVRVVKYCFLCLVATIESTKKQAGREMGGRREPPATPLEANCVSSERSHTNVADHAVAVGSARIVYIGREGPTCIIQSVSKLVPLEATGRHTLEQLVATFPPELRAFVSRTSILGGRRGD